MNINPTQTAHNFPTQPDPKQTHKASQSFTDVMGKQLQVEQKTARTGPALTTQARSDVQSDQQGSTKTDPPQTTKRSAASIEFQEYMSKNDAEKMRLSMLKEMGLTEEEFEQLPPEAQFAIEQKILARLKQQNGVDDTALNTASPQSMFNLS
ncbi:hypothetical protein ACU6U9_05635 [Pseudomonas sp. HK3]